MQEISTELKASEKLSSWIRRQLESAARYVPRKGGICKLCGRFCKTYKTDSETGTRYHRCQHCGINFKTNEKAKAADPVGNLPTKQDAGPVKPVRIDSRKKRKGK